MRVVALLGEALDINTELNVTRKVTVVVGKVIDKLMILDRKHRIRDKIFKGAAATYDTLSSTVSRVQEDIQDRKSESSDRTRQRVRHPEDEDAYSKRRSSRDINDTYDERIRRRDDEEEDGFQNRDRRFRDDRKRPMKKRSLFFK
jgi:hypothetical protein